jgi:hypothetical protein
LEVAQPWPCGIRGAAAERRAGARTNRVPRLRSRLCWLGLAVPAVLGACLANGAYAVDTDEEAVVRRFGAIATDTRGEAHALVRKAPGIARTVCTPSRLPALLEE